MRLAPFAPRLLPASLLIALIVAVGGTAWAMDGTSLFTGANGQHRAVDSFDDLHRAQPQSLSDQDGPILGAALTVLADGTEPWEDRPLAVQGVGTIPGNSGVADPGDDLGPDDGLVRTYDAVVFRASFSVRGGTAEDLVAEVTLSDLARWDASGLDALKLAGCPGGATLLDGGRRLRCIVGRVETPPAVTVALDLSARVSGAALQGDEISAEMTVRAANALPDPDVRNCPVPQTNGCDASSPAVSVSAAPAAELRKYLGSVINTPNGGNPGRRLTWYLEVVLGADGDARGSSHPVGAPWTLQDWWRALGPRGGVVALPVHFERCVSQTPGAEWSCSQPGGPGTPVEVTLSRLDEVAWFPAGVSSTLPQAVGRVRIDLWVPEDDLYAAGGDVTFQNCFATEVNLPSRTVWRPSDARGQANLGGLPEPAANNCSHVVMVGPTPTPTRTRVPPTPRPPGPPAPGRPTPRATATPRLEFSKQYLPFTKGEAVTEGTEFSSRARVRVIAGSPANYVIACDKWDNRTHSLSQGSGVGAEVWWETPGESPVRASERAHVVLEYGAGDWGRMRTTRNVGRLWYEQGGSQCENRDVVAGHGWFLAGDIDFSNRGQGRVNAQDINMVRARFLDPVPVYTAIWLEVPMVAGANPSGTWLMNYGAFGWRYGSKTAWQVGVCYGAQGNGSRRECPMPATGTKDIPGLHGDMLVQVGVPLWLTKQTDPVVPGGSPVINAGDTVAFVLEAATLPRPGDPPPPEFPPGSFAHGVIITDTLPVGLTYELGSATIASEDLNQNGVLDPGEDKNGNGRIDLDVPFAPAVIPGPGDGETTLRWHLGNIPYQTRVPAIRFLARTSRLVRGGTALVNHAGLWSSLDSPPDCRAEHRDLEGGRCAWAQVIVANIAAAQVEKFAKAQLVVAGDPLVFQLALANLTTRPVEWFDGVDILPRPGEPRNPTTHLTGGITGVEARVLPGGSPMEVWASAVDPDVLDTKGGTPRDGLVDPVSAWGGPGSGLGGPDWPCRLSDVGTARCTAIASRSDVTAVRLWGPDPHPSRSGTTAYSLLPPDSPGRWIELTLHAPGAIPGDLAHNAWGGRFESLPLPVFAEAIIQIRPPDTPTPTATPSPSATPPASETPLPSETPTQGPPTETPTPSNTPTATNTATVTSTPTPTPIYTVYLPITVRTKCPMRPVDVVLVIDASSSMLRPAGDGGTKQDAVHRAARAFLDRFEPSPERGRVAVVAFNYRAWIVQPLTSDRSQLDAALRRLPRKIAEGTRLDLGLLVGADALAEVTGDRWRAMVFLTDGMPNRIPTPQTGGSQEDVVRVAAKSVHDQDIPIFTVGYGREDAPELADRILPWLLKEIAGKDGEYYQTDDASTLADRFRRIAEALGCPGEVRWP